MLTQDEKELIAALALQVWAGGDLDVENWDPPLDPKFAEKYGEYAYHLGGMLEKVLADYITKNPPA